MRLETVRSACLLALLTAGAARGAESGCAAPDFNRKANEIIAPYADTHGFSGVVLLASGDRILVRRAFGLADRSWNIPNTPDTRFRIASVGKQFVAAAIMQLVDQGKIELDGPAARYVPDFPAAWAKVTVKELLDHRSGIPDYTDAPGFLEGGLTPPHSNEEILKLVRDRPLAFEPGTKVRYDNTGYAVLAHIIETVSGQSLGDYFDSHLFRPLGMMDTGVDEFGRIVPHLATGYTLGPNGLIEADDLRGVGDPYSTVGDLMKWRQGLFGGRVLSRASLKLMTTDWGDEYGFGMIVHRTGQRVVMSKIGGEPGFRSGLYWYHGDGVTSIALTNFDGVQGYDVASDLAQACVGLRVRPAEVKLSPAMLARFVGAYRITPDEVVQVAPEGDHLIARSSGDAPTPLFAKSDNAFFARMRRIQYVFDLDASGRVTALELRGSNGSPMASFPRVSAQTPAAH